MFSQESRELGVSVCHLRNELASLEARLPYVAEQN